MNLSNSLKKERNIVKLISKFLLQIQYLSIWLLFFNVIYLFIYGPIMSYKNNYILKPALLVIIIEGIMYTLALLFIFTQMDNLIGNLGMSLLYVSLGNILLKPISRPTDFTLGQTYWGFVILMAVISLLIALIKTLIMLFSEIKRIYGILKGKHVGAKKSEKIESNGSGTKDETSESPKRGFKEGVVEIISDYFAKIKAAGPAVLILFILGVGFISAFNILDRTKFGPAVEIKPKDYQISFRMWVYGSPEFFMNHPHGAEVLAQLDKHHVVVQNMIFTIRDENGRTDTFSPGIYPEDEYTVVSNLTWFATHYPNIKFQYYAYGIGYNSCGNYEGSIYTAPMLKRFVDICYKHNLTNVVGVYTDWEGPPNGDAFRSNFTRNGWHQALWYDAMAYARYYFPNWTFSACYPQEVTYDYQDGDNDWDIQYYTRYNIFNPMWDDYGPMIYRSCDREPLDPNQPEDTQRYSTSWYIYSRMYAVVNGALKGDASRATMWIGCTGSGPYQNNTVVYENGKPIGFGNSMGFDALARDILILKSFGIPTVSIFLGLGSFDSAGYIAGFFDQYGYADALDKLNESVNGPESTKPFKIYVDYGEYPDNEIILDFVLNFNKFGNLWLAVLFTYTSWMIAKKKSEKISGKSEEDGGDSRAQSDTAQSAE